jgi:hypothetical protein
MLTSGVPKRKSVNDFDFKTAADAGGVKGSEAVAGVDGIKYQVKYSNQGVKTMKAMKGEILSKHTDRENLGEFIAACVARRALVREGGPELIPEVFLVLDNRSGRHKLMIASRYIQGGIGNVDAMVDKAGRGHVK